MMQFYAADLVRGPDGAWRVLADRTSGAGGVGHARENRRLLAQVIPEAFRPMQVRQLRPFFDVWQDALHRLAPPGRRNPSVALLTQGTADPQWFEHMFLSRELSCALVEGGDLTVRGGAVFLKTLRGLQQVDVLLRRMDGRMLDPLELETRSLQGVSGLLDAARHGTVRIANDAGSGALEAPAFAAFLPALCMRLLGERLAMASVPTMWLGEAQARALVQQEPDRWLIRPAVDGNAHGALANADGARRSPGAAGQDRGAAMGVGGFGQRTAFRGAVPGRSREWSRNRWCCGCSWCSTARAGGPCRAASPGWWSRRTSWPAVCREAARPRMCGC